MALAYGPAQAVMMLLALYSGGPAAEASDQATGTAHDRTPSRGEYVHAGVAHVRARGRQHAGRQVADRRQR